MTIEECNSAAYRRAPIIHDGIIYSRIVRITRVFTSDELMIRGWPKTYYVVTLADKCGHSYTEADPAKVFLANENLHHELNEKKNAADESGAGDVGTTYPPQSDMPELANEEELPF